MTNEKCVHPYTDYSKYDITTNMICAYEPNKDACQGDSGGPIVAYNEEDNCFVQFGIVSWGNGCAGDRFPGVYARITAKLEWIESYITGQTCPPPNQF